MSGFCKRCGEWCEISSVTMTCEPCETGKPKTDIKPDQDGLEMEE